MILRKRQFSSVAAAFLSLILCFAFSVDCCGQEISPTPAADQTIQAIRQQMGDDQQGVAVPNAGDGFTERVPTLREIITRLVYSLVIVVFILVLGLYLLRRFLKIRAPGSSQYIHIISQASLSPKASLHLVRVAGKRLLIGEGPDGVRLISEVPESEGNPLDEESLPEASPETRNRFRRELQKETNEVQQGLLSERLRNAVKNCRDYLGRLKQGGGKNV